MERDDEPDVAGFDDRSPTRANRSARHGKTRDTGPSSRGGFRYPDVDDLDDGDEMHALPPERGRHAARAQRRRIPWAPVLVAGAVALGVLAGVLVWFQPGSGQEDIAAEAYENEGEDDPFSGGAAGPPVSSPDVADEEEATEPEQDAEETITPETPDAAEEAAATETSQEESSDAADSGADAGGDSGEESAPERAGDDADTPPTDPPGRDSRTPPAPPEDEEEEEDEDDECRSWLCWW